MAGSSVPRDNTISREMRGFLDDLSRAQLKNNYTATTAPGVTNDKNSGYAVGSRWINLTTKHEFVCLDTTVGAAVWKQTT